MWIIRVLGRQQNSSVTCQSNLSPESVHWETQLRNVCSENHSHDHWWQLFLSSLKWLQWVKCGYTVNYIIWPCPLLNIHSEERIQARITNWNIHLLMICHCQVSNFFSFAMEFLDKNLHFTALLIESSIGVHPIGVYLQFYQTGCMNHNYGFAIIFHWGKLTEFLLALLGLTSSASIHLPYSTHGRCIMLFQGYNWLVYCLLLRTHS